MRTYSSAGLVPGGVGAPLARSGKPEWRGVDRYFALWGIVLPVSSILALPFLQGTTPAYLLALFLVLPPVTFLLMGLEDGGRYYRSLLFLALVFAGLTAAAQFALAGSGLRHLSSIPLVDPWDKSIVFRRTLVTQSLYLLAAGCTFVFVRMFYRPEWDRYLLTGVGLLALYGIFEVAFFAVTGRSGDFLSNRTFGGGWWPGSAFQTISIGPLLLQRLKSLTGEPSMYAFTVLPFWIYCVHARHRWLGAFLLLTLLLTTSTTALLGIALYLLYRLVRFGPGDRLALAGVIAGGAVALSVAAGGEFLSDAVRKIILTKLSLGAFSGLARFRSFQAGMDAFLGAPLMTQLFGFGFGYARSTDMLSTLLINLGVVGFLLTAVIFFLPFFALGNGYREEGLKGALLVVFVTMMVSVPEFSYLSTWLFLGMAYRQLDLERKQHRRTLGAALPAAG